MNTIVENLTGMNVMTDQVIAQDLLIAAKSGIKNYALAITETATPEIRSVLQAQLQDAISFHAQLTDYMVQKGWYKAFDVQEQINLVKQNAQTALGVGSK